MKRILIFVVAVAAAAGAVSPASAKRAPVRKSFSANAPAPDPTNFGNAASPETFNYSVCQGTVPQSRHTESLTVPASGRLVVTLTGFVGDWDLLLLDSKGKELTASGEAPATDERMTYKMKKAGTLKIIACNWAGSPNASGTYTFTFDK